MKFIKFLLILFISINSPIKAESNQSLINELKKGGARIIHHHDHRIVMSFYIANLICIKNNVIKDKSSVKTSYPSFFKDTGKYFH